MTRRTNARKFVELLGAAVVVALLFAVPGASANRATCGQRAEREHRWNRDHSWWDGRSQRWHNDRDWDRDDNDRDHDHDNH